MDPAVVGISPGARKCERIGEAAIMYSRVEYSVRIARRAGSGAMIIPRPSPSDGIAGLDCNGARIVVRSALPHSHVSRRRASELKCCCKRDRDGKCGKQA